MKKAFSKISFTLLILTSFSMANSLNNLSLNNTEVNTIRNVKIKYEHSDVNITNYVNQKLKILEENLVKKGLTPEQAKLFIIEQIKKKEKKPLESVLEKKYKEAFIDKTKNNLKNFKKSSKTYQTKNIVNYNNSFVKFKLIKVPVIPRFLNECISYNENIIKRGNIKNVHVKFVYKTGYKKKISQILSIINELQLNNPTCKFYIDNLKQNGQVYTLKENFVCKLNNKNSFCVKKLNNLLTNNINYDKIFDKYQEKMNKEFFILQQLMNRIFNSFIRNY